MKMRKIVSLFLVILMFMLVSIFLTSCPGYGQRTSNLTFKTYEEMLEFATQHKQEFDSDDCVFIIFDLDEYENISTDTYFVNAIWHDPWAILNVNQSGEIGSDHWPVSVKCTFKMDGVDQNGMILQNAYEVSCIYTGQTESENENTMGIASSYINAYDAYDECGYNSRYSTFVEGNIAIDISINHDHIATQEELDAIVWMFLENTVIID